MPERLRAITFDMWGTLIWPRDTEAKMERRMELLMSHLHRVGHVYDREAIQRAWREALRESEYAFRRSLRDLGPPARWRRFALHLGVDPDTLPLTELMAAYEQLTLEFLPEPMPGVQRVVADLSRRYRLGVICNTGLAPGTTLRTVLARHGLLHAFQVLTFSDEYGCLKPDPSIFHHTLEQLGASPRHALHVGDLEELDVEGAHAAGMRAARYDYFETAFEGRPKPPTRAELRFKDWAQFPSLLEKLDAAA